MKKSILLIPVLLIVFSCGRDASDHYAYQIPENINDGFAVGSLDEVGIDAALIEKGVDAIRSGRYQEVHSMLFFKDDRLVFEEYFEGHDYKYDGAGHHGELVTWDGTMLHDVMSVTKSVTSACIGIAVDMGFIESVHQSIFDYLPEYQYLITGGKERITIEHLLTMTSGLEWNERALPYSNLKNDVVMTYQVEDPIAYVLNKPLIHEPGESFYYSGGNDLLLGEILKYATEMNIDRFSGKYLFGPLEIEPYYWTQYKNGVIDAAGGVKITPRDMAKIGVAFLNKGVWNGKRIISEHWVDKSATSFPGNSWLNYWDDHWGMKGYGYTWWTHHFVKSGKRLDMYYAAGWGGQYIMVIPERNTVVVFTGGNYTSYRPPFEILKKYVLSAYK